MDNWEEVEENSREEIKDDANWAEVLDMVSAMLNKTEAAQLVYELKIAVKNEAQQILNEIK